MRCADRLARLRAAAALAATALLLCACGGSSTTTTYSGDGGVVTLATPTGPNTTEIVVDASYGFGLGVTNVPYVTITVCAPGSSTACTIIDHVFLDTGSYGLRLLKSKVAALNLPPVALAADPNLGTPAGNAVECYAFVLGGIWGPLAQADVHIEGEVSDTIPIQVLDDSSPPAIAPTADCAASANGGLITGGAGLAANGILGVGQVAYDCGLTCNLGDYTGGHIQYYVCPDNVSANCRGAAIPTAMQVQNPVAHFPVDNNGTLIALPALPKLGALVAKGRLVFGIGTRANNQLPLSVTQVFVDPNPNNPGYLYQGTTVGAASYPFSYIDSGSNGLFFHDTGIAQGCQASAGQSAGGWYCPAATLDRSATITDVYGTAAPVSFSIANADTLFATTGTAFANLGGDVTSAPETFVWGLSFFFGRTVYTSIWYQQLSPNGPWNAF